MAGRVNDRVAGTEVDAGPYGSKQQVISLVSDSRDWTIAAVRQCVNLNVVPEIVRWRSANIVAQPGHALLADLRQPFDVKSRVLSQWADAALQPVCIISITPEFGSAAVVIDASQLGFQVVHNTHDDFYWNQLRPALLAVLDSSAYLVPRIASVLGCSDGQVVEALTVAFSMSPSRMGVAGWANELGIRRRELATTFQVRRLPMPGEILPWIRLARVVDYAHHNRSITRRDLARRFSYGNGDFLGKRARAMTGMAFRALVADGVHVVFRCMAHWIASR